MKKTLSMILALCLVLSCAWALAEEPKTCTYTIFNGTGEKVTELFVTDNTTGEKSSNYAGEEGLPKDGIMEIYGTDKEGYVVTLSFKTEGGHEGAFETLHFEDVPITLLSAETIEANKAAAGEDAKTGATPIAFKAPVCTYTVYNTTGEKVTELFVTDNTTGEKSENYAGEGLANGASVEINGSNKVGYVVTLSFETESGREGAFETLHFETVPISLLAADAMTGATVISFKAPEAK